jgi:hypothetical protein
MSYCGPAYFLWLSQSLFNGFYFHTLRMWETAVERPTTALFISYKLILCHSASYYWPPSSFVLDKHILRCNLFFLRSQWVEQILRRIGWWTALLQFHWIQTHTVLEKVFQTSHDGEISGSHGDDDCHLGPHHPRSHDTIWNLYINVYNFFGSRF